MTLLLAGALDAGKIVVIRLWRASDSLPSEWEILALPDPNSINDPPPKRKRR